MSEKEYEKIDVSQMCQTSRLLGIRKTAHTRRRDDFFHTKREMECFCSKFPYAPNGARQMTRMASYAGGKQSSNTYTADIYTYSRLTDVRGNTNGCGQTNICVE